MVSDETIVDLIGCSAPKGVEMLYDQYGGVAFSLAMRILEDNRVAADVLEGAFLAIWRNEESYSSELGTLRAWLLSIVHQRSIERLPGKPRRRRRADGALDAVSARAAPNDRITLGPSAPGRPEARRALARLTAQERQVTELAYFIGRTQSEISMELGIAPVLVTERIRAALEKLHDELDSLGDDVATA